MAERSIGLPSSVVSASPFHQSSVCGTPEPQRMCDTQQQFTSEPPPLHCTHASRSQMMSAAGVCAEAIPSWAPCSSAVGPGPQQLQYPSYAPSPVVGSGHGHSRYPSQLACVPQSAVVSAVTSMSFMHPRPSAPLECGVPVPGPAPPLMPSSGAGGGGMGLKANLANACNSGSPARECNGVGVPVGYTFQVPKSSAFSANGGHNGLSFANGSIECFSDDSSALGGSGSISAYQPTPGTTGRVQ